VGPVYRPCAALNTTVTRSTVLSSKGISNYLVSGLTASPRPSAGLRGAVPGEVGWEMKGYKIGRRKEKERERRNERGKTEGRRGKRRREKEGSFAPTVVFKTRCLWGRRPAGAPRWQKTGLLVRAYYLTAQLISRCGAPLIDCS